MFSLQHKFSYKSNNWGTWNSEQKNKCKMLADSQPLKIVPLSHPIGVVLYHAFQIEHLVAQLLWGLIHSSNKCCLVISVCSSTLCSFSSPVSLKHSCYMLSAPPLSTVSHSAGIFSAAAQVCCYFSLPATKCNRHGYAAGHRSSYPCVPGRGPKQRSISSHQKITWLVFIWKCTKMMTEAFVLLPHCTHILCTARHFCHCSLRI